MTKRELIDEITHLNATAKPEFLARFEAPDLAEYLGHLKWVVPPGNDDQAQEADAALADLQYAGDPRAESTPFAEKRRRTEAQPLLF